MESSQARRKGFSGSHGSMCFLTIPTRKELPYCETLLQSQLSIELKWPKVKACGFKDTHLRSCFHLRPSYRGNYLLHKTDLAKDDMFFNCTHFKGVGSM